MIERVNNCLSAVHLPWRICRVNRRQILPAEIPDASAYGLPEGQDRLLRPWEADAAQSSLFPDDVTQNTMLSRVKLYYLRSLFLQAASVPGDVFEAGAGNGGSSRLLLNTMEALHTRDKQLWVLDTFAGYSGANPAVDGNHAKDGDMVCATEAQVAALLKSASVRVRTVAGAIPESLTRVDARRFCFAHIDVNLYRPTAAAARFCMERMSDGGIIVFDDYGWPATYGARQAIDEVIGEWKHHLVSLAESTQAFVIRHNVPEMKSA